MSMPVAWSGVTLALALMVSPWSGMKAVIQYLSVMPNQPPLDCQSTSLFFFQSL